MVRFLGVGPIKNAHTRAKWGAGATGMGIACVTRMGA
jgi:hypothetical protein